MPETLVYTLLLFFFLSIGLLIGLASFAFADPRSFALWLPPMSFLFREKSEAACRVYSFIFGSFCVGLILILSFIFGSLSASFALDLWTSPLFRMLEKMMN